MPSLEIRPFGGVTPLCLLVSILVRMVHARFWWLGWPRIEDAVMAAIERLLEQDEHILRDADIEIAEDVVRCLYASAIRNVDNGIRTERRRSQRECQYAGRKNHSDSANFFVANGLFAEDISIEDDVWEKLLEDFCAWERSFVELRRQGCRKVSAYAHLLDMEKCPVGEQRQAVKQTWDRLLKKLQRRGKGLWLRLGA